MKLSEFEIGQGLTVEMKPTSQGFFIGKTDEGVVCFSRYLSNQSTYKIVKVDETKLIVTPEFNIGEKLELVMQQGIKNKLPVSRTETGMICLMSKDLRGYYEYGTTWICEVVDVREKMLIVTPVKQIRTASETQTFLAKKLKSIGNKEPIPKHAKFNNTKKYQFKTKNELIKTPKIEVLEKEFAEIGESIK